MNVQTAGIMYEGWHAPVTQALTAWNVTKPWSVEELLRYEGTSYFANETTQYDLSAALGFIYHTIPEIGMLHQTAQCLYY